MTIRIKLRTVVASIDFVIGFFLLFGGGNLWRHGQAARELALVNPGYRAVESPGEEEIVGILSMFLGLMLFLSASRITRGHKPRFRPFVYLLIAPALGVGVFRDQYAARSASVSRRDILGWALLMIVVIACILLQRALKSSPSMRSQT